MSIALDFVTPHALTQTMTTIKTKELELKLLNSLRSTAQKIGPIKFFWETFVEELLAGRVEGIDPLNHLKQAKPLDSIAEDIHNILMPDIEYKTITPETRAIYLRIIKAVNDGLQY